MNVAETQKLIRHALRDLYPSGEIAAIERILFEHLLHYSPVDIIMRQDRVLPDFVEEKMRDAVARLGREEPIQHIVGVADFHGHQFKVTRDTLVPRPETEQLVDMITDECGDRYDLRVLDIGTGSGCIAISLALALKFASVDALDVSAEALAIANVNAAKFGAKVNFVYGDILCMPNSKSERYDIVVSNPPYVLCSEKEQMQKNVLDYDPALALFVPDDNPLLFYKAIASYCNRALRAGGRLFLEINAAFGQQVKDLLIDAGYNNVEVRRDFCGRDRFVTATR